MATLNGTIQDVSILTGEAVSGIQVAHVLYTVTGDYDQAASAPIEILLVSTAIEDSVRNGKTVTLVDACSGPAGLIGTTEYHQRNTVINTAAVECDLYTAAGAEHAAATMGTVNRPLSFYVAYLES
jgi:hypothetical protein